MIITDTGGCRGGHGFHWRLSVCLSVCLSPGYLKTGAARITKLHIKIPTGVLETHLFWGQKVKGQGHEAQKTVPQWVLRSCECWLRLVCSDHWLCPNV